MRPKRLTALVLGLLAVGGAAAPAALANRSASALAPVRLHVLARSSARHGPTVTGALQALLHSGTITEASYSQYEAGYLAAAHSLGKLRGTRHEELGAVLANVQAMAAAGELIPSRLGAVFLTLERNRSWWTTGPLLSADERVSFPGSRIVWEHYPGQGLEIQWLATFGEGNGYFSGQENTNLRQLLGEIIPLATDRAGGIAWEYLFHFDGGTPPWTSGLSQGTALQLLARAYPATRNPCFWKRPSRRWASSRPRRPREFASALPPGPSTPSTPMRHRTASSTASSRPSWACTTTPRSPRTRSGSPCSKPATRRPGHRAGYDTGAWSLYDQFGESDLNYHELLTEFLQHLCERTRKGPPVSITAPATTVPPATTPTTTPTGAPVAGGTAAGTSLRGRSAATSTSTPIPGDAIYCTTAQNFTTDLHTPPVLALLSSTLAGGVRAGVQLSLSKISTVTMTVRQGSRVVWSTSATVERGKPKLLWATPKNGGTFSVTLAARDLAGNFSTASGTVVVKRD